MAEFARIYLRLLQARLRAQLHYRVSLLLQLVGAFCLSFTDFLTIVVIFQHLPYLAGWSLGEIAFLYGTSYVTFRCVDLVIGQLDSLPQQIQRGEFDLVLIRPLGTLFQVLTSDLGLRQLGGVLQGLAVLLLSLSLVHIHWNPLRALLFAQMPLSGGVIFAGVWIMGATTTFWTVRAMEMVNAVTYGGNMLTSYPMHIYAGWLRRFFTFVIPLAFVNYFPALYILDKPDPLGLPDASRFLAPLIAALLLGIAWSFWNVGVRHYRSTGS